MPTDPGSRMIRTRAMNRALGRLRDAHRDEYERYFAEELAHAQAEAEAHTAAARVQHPGEQPPVKTGVNPGPPFKPRPPMPPALLPGPPRKHGRDSVVDGIPVPAGPLPPVERPAPRLREDVARCSYCVRFHEQGHKCTVCKSEPKAGPSKREKARVWSGEATNWQQRLAERMRAAEWRIGTGSPAHYLRPRGNGEVGPGAISLCGLRWVEPRGWDRATPVASAPQPERLCARCDVAVTSYQLPRPPTAPPLATPPPTPKPTPVDVAPSRAIQTVAYTSDEILDRVADLRSRKAAPPADEPRPEPRTRDDGRTWGLCRACSTTITVRGDCRCTREAESA